MYCVFNCEIKVNSLILFRRSKKSRQSCNTRSLERFVERFL